MSRRWGTQLDLGTPSLCSHPILTQLCQQADPFALASSQPSHASLHGASHCWPALCREKPALIRLAPVAGSQQRGFGQELQRVRDIDAEAAEDPFACATYAAEIFDNLFEAEVCWSLSELSHAQRCALTQ